MESHRIPWFQTTNQIVIALVIHHHFHSWKNPIPATRWAPHRWGSSGAPLHRQPEPRVCRCPRVLMQISWGIYLGKMLTSDDWKRLKRVRLKMKLEGKNRFDSFKSWFSVDFSTCKPAKRMDGLWSQIQIEYYSQPGMETHWKWRCARLHQQ